MRNNNKINSKVKEQIEKFCISLTKNLFKPEKKFISQMIFGIQASRDVKLSNISRSLNEQIKLIKVENRLSRHIGKRDLTEGINKVLIKRGAERITKDTVLAIDLSDINKPFAKKMEHLTDVWNGSEGKVGKGYWISEVVGADVKGEEVTPLYAELYSQEAVDFESENKQIIKAISRVNEEVKRKGIWVIDRGGDRRKIIEKLDEMDVSFVIRINLRRNIKDINEEEMNVLEFANKLKYEEKFYLTIDEEGYQKKIEVSLAMAKGIEVCGIKLNLVAVKGFGKYPMLLLTNVQKEAKEILEIYLTRWKCEESFRFLKQEYHLEDVRVRSYIGLRNTVVLLQAVFYFLAVYIGRRLKMSILLKKILEKAKRFFQIPIFKQYAIADGIYRILFNSKWDDGERDKKINEIGFKQGILDFALDYEL
jgi:hypothetical protein